MPDYTIYHGTTSPEGVSWTLADAASELVPDDNLNRTTRVFLIGFLRPEYPTYFIDEVMPEGFHHETSQGENDPWVEAESYQYGFGEDKDIVLGQAQTIEEAITGCDKHASFKFFGSVSSGTMRREDLIPTFEKVLEILSPASHTGDYDCDVDNLSDGEKVDYLIELDSELNSFAPTGYYFGAHPGDGADFGFWPIVED